MPHRPFAEADESFVFEISPGKHVIKGSGQFQRQRAVNLQAEVAPAAQDTVPFPLWCDIVPADETDLLIADEQFAVVADVEPAEGQRIEPAHVPAGAPQGL